jgi:membrane protein implicated in regulation of membrane protease activity
MEMWWSGLTAASRGFYLAAVFFSTLFIWQLISALSGLGGEDSVESDHGDLGDHDAGHLGDHGGGYDAAGHEATPHSQGDTDHDDAGLHTFRLLSVRSLLAFGMLFSWAGALYAGQGEAMGWALIRALLWGLTGMLVVAAFFWLLPRLSEEGTARLSSAVGEMATVYIDIPEDGAGQIKVTVGGALGFVRARARGNQRLPAGTQVRVLRLLDESTVEVEEIES